MTKEEIAEWIESTMLYVCEKQAKKAKEKRDCAIKDNNLVEIWNNNGYLSGMECEIEDLKKIIKMLKE